MPTALHPHHYTLALLKHLLDKAEHTLFPGERLEQMKQQYEKVAADATISQTQIAELTAQLGKEIWPYHEALEELYRRHGKKKEEQAVRDKLTSALREKYERFLAQGGSLTDFRRGAQLEVFFTPEEKFQIGQAVVEANHAVLQEIASACRLDLKSECEQVIADHQEKLTRVQRKLATLKELAARSDKWRLEIEDKIRTFEESFGYLTKTFHEEDIDGTLDYYQGVIESPEFE